MLVKLKSRTRKRIDSIWPRLASTKTVNVVAMGSFVCGTLLKSNLKLASIL